MARGDDTDEDWDETKGKHGKNKKKKRKNMQESGGESSDDSEEDIRWDIMEH